MRNRFLSVVACLLVCSFVIMPFSAFADDVPDIEESLEWRDPEEMWQESGCYAIWLILKSWGINITADEVIEWSDAVRAELENKVIEFLDTLPSVAGIFSWVNPWLWDVDFWGNARFNSSMLEDVQDFADWLVDTLGLSDNSTHVINPVYSVNGAYTLYEYDKWYGVDATVGNPFFVAMEMTEQTDYPVAGYFIAHPENSDSYYIYHVLFSGVPNQTFSVRQYYMYENGNTFYGSNSITIQSPNLNGLYYARQIASWYGTVLLGDFYEYTSDSELQFFLNNFEVVATGDMRYVTLDITLPVETPDYTPGDSLIIIGDEPTYEVFDWDGRVTVENLPAVISKTNLENPGLIELFRPVQAFVTTFSDGLALVRGIIYELPSEAIIIMFTLMGCAILIGIIHIMKEH